MISGYNIIMATLTNKLIKMKQGATQKDIGKLCGVSAACVGYILSGNSKYKFKQETVDLVKQTAEKLHYRPNQQAAGLRRKENKLIICIVGSSCRYTDTLHIQKLEEEIEKYGYHLLVHFIVGLADDRKVDFIKKVINLPAGLLIWSLGIQDPEKQKKLIPVLRKAPPTLHMSHALPGTGADYIKILWGGSSLPGLIDFFRQKSFKRIGCCLGYEEYRHEICSSFKELAQQAGMEGRYYYDESIRQLDYYEMGRRIGNAILKERVRPDALYCVSDEMAFTLIDTLRAGNIAVPDDIFIVSGGDSEFLKNMASPPPYFIHDIPLLVSMAVRDIISRIEDGEQASGNERCVGEIEQSLVFPQIESQSTMEKNT